MRIRMLENERCDGDIVFIHETLRDERRGQNESSVQFAGNPKRTCALASRRHRDSLKTNR